MLILYTGFTPVSYTNTRAGSAKLNTCWSAPRPGVTEASPQRLQKGGADVPERARRISQTVFARGVGRRSSAGLDATDPSESDQDHYRYQDIPCFRRRVLRHRRAV